MVGGAAIFGRKVFLAEFVSRGGYIEDEDGDVGGGSLVVQVEASVDKTPMRERFLTFEGLRRLTSPRGRSVSDDDGTSRTCNPHREFVTCVDDDDYFDDSIDDSIDDSFDDDDDDDDDDEITSGTSEEGAGGRDSKRIGEMV